MDFVEYVARNWEDIKEGNKWGGNQTYLLEVPTEHNDTLIVELSKDGSYWSISTAGVFRKSYSQHKKEVYNRHATAKQPTETVGTSQIAEQSGTQAKTSMNAPTTSESKGSENSENARENAENLQGNGEFNTPQGENTEAPRFSISDKGPRTMLGVHSITEEKLRNGIKWGVAINPSFAFYDRSIPETSLPFGFGGITFLASRDMLDNMMNNGEIVTQTGDTWSSEVPRKVMKRVFRSWRSSYKDAYEALPYNLKSNIDVAFWRYNDFQQEAIYRGWKPEQINTDGLRSALAPLYASEKGVKFTGDPMADLQTAYDYLNEGDHLKKFDEWFDKFLKEEAPLKAYISNTETEYTPENLSEHMRREDEANPSIEQRLYKQLYNTDDIRDNRHRLEERKGGGVSSDWAYSAIDKMAGEEDFDKSLNAAIDIFDYYCWDERELASPSTYEGFKETMQTNYPALTDDDVKDIFDYFRYMRFERQVPAYFEGKSRRNVPWSDFSAMIAPENLSQDIRDYFEDMGMPIYYYKQDGTGREEALTEATKADDGIMFSVEENPQAQNENARFSTDEKEPKPIGKGAFGDIYDQFRGKPKEAIAFLMRKGSGEAIGALHHKDIGDIDLVWGKEGTSHSDGYGLAKLVKYHPEVLNNLQELLDDMHIVTRSENRINLESDKYYATVRLTWDDENKTWLLTAFEKTKSSAPSNTTDTAKTLKGKRNDTATPQNATSESKGSENSENARENAENLQGEGEFNTPQGEARFSAQEQERQDIIEKARQDGTLGKAPNGAESNLMRQGGEQLWATVRTPAFKNWFGDWESAAKVQAIEAIRPTAVESKPMTRQEAWNNYKQIGIVANKADNREVNFTNASFKKRYRKDGLFVKAIPALKEAFENSILAYTTTDTLKGTKRKDGTIHKEHPNIKWYHNYIGKVRIDGNDYYARFTIKEERGNAKDKLHSTFVTNVELYKKGTTPLALTYPSIELRGKHQNEVVDVKLQQFFDNARKNAENSSKVVDENGEPKVVYHGSYQWFTQFNNGDASQYSHSNAPRGTIFTTDNREVANSYISWYGESNGEVPPVAHDVYLDENDPRHREMPWGTLREGGIYPLFMNLRNPLVVDFDGKLWRESPIEGKDINDVVAEEMSNGEHDGVIAMNVKDVGATDLSVEEIPTSNDYIAFNPNQVKSIDNNGNFSNVDNDIRFSTQEAQQGQEAPQNEDLFARAERIANNYQRQREQEGDCNAEMVSDWQDKNTRGYAKRAPSSQGIF